MKKLNFEDGDFSIVSHRYVLCGRKHGDTAYVRLKDTQEGVIYEVDDINWDVIPLLVGGGITWKDFLFDVILG